MERLKRKNRTLEDLGIVSNGGMADLIDNAVKEIYRINDKEYDYIAENTTDEDLGILMETDLAGKELTFSHKREVIRVLDKYLKEMEEKDGE